MHPDLDKQNISNFVLEKGYFVRDFARFLPGNNTNSPENSHFHQKKDDIPRNDLMLLKLDKELKQTDTINYACLPQNRFDTPKPGDMCTIAGWGVHSKNTNISWEKFYSQKNKNLSFLTHFDPFSIHSLGKNSQFWKKLRFELSP